MNNYDPIDLMQEPTEVYSDSIQSFEVLRSKGMVYVDKTDIIYELVRFPKKYFLSRPRRFGKSLLISTIEAFFKGQKDLFQGLAIERLEKEWTTYPVIHIDFNTGDYSSVAGLKEKLNYILKSIEDKYGIEQVTTSIGLRFLHAIEQIVAKEKSQVVVLVDEYDKPLVNNLGNLKELEQMRDIMRDFYGVIKSVDKHIRFAMLTGVMRFRHLSIFSGPNNLTDISMERAYSTICGITEEELEKYYNEGILRLAATLQKDKAETLKVLKENYDGYKFYKDSPLLYNPYSLARTFSSLQVENYWSYSGTPKFLVDLLRAKNWVLSDINDSWLSADYLSLPDLNLNDPLSIMFQTGYLTIRDYDEDLDEYLLVYPNHEVRDSFMKFLGMSYFDGQDELRLALQSIRQIKEGKVKEFMTGIQTFLADVPFDSVKKIEESHFHNFTYLLCRLIGLKTRTEYHTSDGSIDMTIDTPSYFYIFEFKVDKTANEALAQIKNKGYYDVAKGTGKEIVLVGANFSTKSRRLDDWEIESMKS